MTLKQIAYFLEVVKEMNMTRAAANLYVSQTAITKQIHLLEEELGLQLFTRLNKSISLTAAGSYFKEQAEILHKQYQLLNVNMQAYKKGEIGKLRIGLIKYIDLSLIITVFQQFQLKYPNIHCTFHSMSSKEIETSLAAGKIDLGIGIDHHHHKTIPLKTYPLILIYNNNKSKILYDVRQYYDDFPPIEDILIRISLNEGSAILHGFMQEYNHKLHSKELNETSTIVLLYDNHYSQTKNIFIKYLKDIGY